ncbi:Nuclear receptor-binding protein homolog [Eumeta japonica]|uniref:Nuclear receptor-binding protein homolog n=1 Tax=Eumeta variegata TaxID=151549 RepID=A0A4C1VM00_EUMVA|nr:Nuclear receptor-binding protein homolog [Eumeta japonica]
MSGGRNIDKERKSPRESGEDSEDESEILEESPCGRWLKRREEKIILDRVLKCIVISTRSYRHCNTYYNVAAKAKCVRAAPAQLNVHYRHRLLRLSLASMPVVTAHRRRVNEPSVCLTDRPRRALPRAPIMQCNKLRNRNSLLS